MRLYRLVWSGFALVAGACVYPSLPGRPASLDKVGVRSGGDWLTSSLFHENTRLGSVTQMIRRKTSREFAIVGTSGAEFLSPNGGPARLVEFREAAGRVELIEWPGGELRYLDRGGGGWQAGALIGADGAPVWRVGREDGMDDITVGDLDGDGLPEFVVGYNGGVGVSLLDATGKERWRKPDGNVWHVEIVGDGQGKPQILHSNAAGQMTFRDAEGNVLKRVSVESYLAQFVMVQWPPGQDGVFHATAAGFEVLNYDGTVRARLDAPDGSELYEVQAVGAQVNGGDYLAVAASSRHWNRTQVLVFDKDGTLRFREVTLGECGCLSAPEPNAFLLGCGSRVLRYSSRRTTGVTR
jgi:hypothetical protein